eukprot:TRINITY_DN9944_c0_g1_i3.p1 TRINITY_DN9944_c0_g1~~TRINITY_DN9944_c0_g1_i3.p1  ORF type:complete len:448 (-),score=78.71 TRINITY_DN9944_c0_g1_i3:217-1560(-)
MFVYSVILFSALVRVTKMNPNEMIVVDTGEDSSDDSDEASVEHDVSGVDIFVATSEWQEIKPGQGIPRGLHVRINMETGKREAKLYQDESKDSTKNRYDPEELKQALKNINDERKADSQQDSNRFRSIHELKSEFEEVNTKVETEFEIVDRLVLAFEQLKQEESETEAMVNILVNLEYYLHKYDNAIDFLTIKGIDRVLRPSLNASQIPELQQNAAFIIGSAAQSNPKVQIAFLEAGFVQSLMWKLDSPISVDVRSKCLYALAAILRNFPEAQNVFFSSGGLEVFSRVFKENPTENLNKIKIKMLTLVQDLLDERDNLDESLPSAAERKIQYDKTDLQDLMKKSGWCQVYKCPDLLGESTQDPLDHDRIEKVVTAMVRIKEICAQDFLQDLELQTTLKNLHSHYTTLMQEEKYTDGDEGDTDAFFSNLVTSLEAVIVQSNLNLKTEL